MNKNTSFFNQQNKYGYIININHPKIKPLYEDFKKEKNAIILSDDERFEFESNILRKIERKKNDK